jgi:putative Mg2+ transporter-C (MgtC) family protein
MNYIFNLEVVLCFRLLIALVLGLLIGSQRRRVKGDIAVLRTHILICVGSAFISGIGIILADSYDVDITRLAAQIISGIGFLGAGVILKDGGSISGLTTASTIWFIGCIGIGVGFGLYIISIFATIIIFIFLSILKDEHNDIQPNNKSN